MDITRQQAIDLLQKWQEAGRVIQGGVFQSNDGATSGFLGRIERLDNQSLTIDARSLFLLGDRCGLQLPIKNVDYSYSDWRDAPEASPTAVARSIRLSAVYCDCPWLAYRVVCHQTQV